MLVQHLLETRIGAAFGETKTSVSDMEEFYREAKKRYDTDEKFAAASRDCVVKLHNHEPQILSLWRNIVNLSLQEISMLLFISLSTNSETRFFKSVGR